MARERVDQWIVWAARSKVARGGGMVEPPLVADLAQDGRRDVGEAELISLVHPLACGARQTWDAGRSIMCRRRPGAAGTVGKVPCSTRGSSPVGTLHDFSGRRSAL